MSTQRSPGQDAEHIAVALREANGICLDADPEGINEQELMEYYHLKGAVGGIKLKMMLGRQYLLQRLADNPPHPRMTVAFQRMRRVRIGEHVFIGPHVHIDFLYPHLVTIDDFVSIGMNSMIFAHSNPTCSVWLKKKLYPRSVAPVHIKKGAWIPPGTMILPGVTVGEHSVIGAGSTVIRNVEPFTMVAGQPAKFVKRLT